MYSQEPGFTSTYIERDGIDSDCWREKEASVKLGGRGLLFEGFGPLRDRKGAQERTKEASVKGQRPSSRQRKQVSSLLVGDPFLKDSGRSEDRKGSSSRQRKKVSS